MTTDSIVEPVRPRRNAKPQHSGPSRPRWLTVVLAVTVFALGSLSFGAWAASSSIGSTPDGHFHLPSVACMSYAGNVCEPDEATGLLVVSEALIEGLSCTTQRPNQSAGCQPLMNGSDTRTRPHGDINSLRNLYPFGFYETMHVFYQDDLELAYVTARWFNGILFMGLTMLLWWASPPRLRSTIQWMWPLAIVPLGMFFIASINPSSWAIIGVGTAWMALLGFLESKGPKRWVLGFVYLFSIVVASSARIDATLFVIATSLVSFWLYEPDGKSVVLRVKNFLTRAQWLWVGAALFLSALAFIGLRLFLRPGNLGTVTGGFGPRLDWRYQDELTWSSLRQTPTFGEQLAPPTFDWNLLWRNFWEVPGLWFGVLGGYPWGSLGWLDTSMPQMVPIIALAALIAVATVSMIGADWRRITGVLGMFAVLWFVPLYLLQIGGYRVGEEFQPRYLIPLIVVLIGVLVIRSKNQRPIFVDRFPLIAIAVGLSIANALALHTNIRRYVTGMDVGGMDLNYATEWWWWFMPEFFTPNLLWFGGSLAFAGVAWIVIYYLPRQEILALAQSAEVADKTTTAPVAHS